GRGAGFGVPPCLRCAFLLVAWCFGGVWWWFDVARGVFFWPCVWRGRACVLGVCVGRVCAGGGVFCPGATTWARARGGHGRGVVWGGGGCGGGWGVGGGGGGVGWWGAGGGLGGVCVGGGGVGGGRGGGGGWWRGRGRGRGRDYVGAGAGWTRARLRGCGRGVDTGAGYTCRPHPPAGVADGGSCNPRWLCRAVS